MMTTERETLSKAVARTVAMIGASWQAARPGYGDDALPTDRQLSLEGLDP
jgi:hypothetical protein